MNIHLFRCKHCDVIKFNQFLLIFARFLAIFSFVYEHVKYGGPDLWKILHVLYNKIFDSASVPSGSLMGMILPLFCFELNCQKLCRFVKI